MENRPYAVFTFEKKVKTFKGHLKGKLTEEKGFFEAAKIPAGSTLGEVVEKTPLLKELLKAFTAINLQLEKTATSYDTRDLPLATKIKLNGKNVFLEISKYSETPYAIILSVTKAKDIKKAEENFTTKEGASEAKAPITAAEAASTAAEAASVQTVFKEIIEAIPTAIAILDDKSNILDVNTQFERLFGYKKAEITGVNINELDCA